MASVRWYSTEYNEPLDGQNYGSGCYATAETLADVVNKRGLGERQMFASDVYPERGWPLPSKTIKELHLGAPVSTLKELLHTAMWVGYQATKADPKGVDLAFGDKGVVHELVHIINDLGFTDYEYRELHKHCLELELLVPGLLNEAEQTEHWFELTSESRRRTINQTKESNESV
jgi:hypothetical protein